LCLWVDPLAEPPDEQGGTIDVAANAVAAGVKEEQREKGGKY
jgi:hypothetical protein